MEFDFIKYRNNNNIFGRDLWYLTITGYGAYASLLKSSKNNPPNRIFYVENVNVSMDNTDENVNEKVDVSTDITDEYVNTVSHITNHLPIPKHQQIQKQVPMQQQQVPTQQKQIPMHHQKNNTVSHITNNLPIPKHQQIQKQQKSKQIYRAPPPIPDEDDSKTTSTILDDVDDVNTSLIELSNKAKTNTRKQYKPTLSSQSQRLSLDALQQLNEHEIAMDSTYEPELDVISDESDNDVSPEDLRAKSVVGQDIGLTQRMKIYKQRMIDDVEKSKPSSTHRKAIIIKSKEPDTVPFPLKQIVIAVKPNEDPKSITKQMHKNIANNWYNTLTKQKENKLSRKEQQELSRWDRYIQTAHKIYGDPSVTAKEYIQRSKDSLMRWKEQSSLKPRTNDWIDDEEQQSITDIMQNTVSGTNRVVNELQSLKPRTNDWIDDEEQHSVTDVVRNTAKASAAVIGKTYSLTKNTAKGSLQVAKTGANAAKTGITVAQYATVGTLALGVVGAWLSSVMTSIVAHPAVVATSMSLGWEPVRTEIQNYVGLVEGVSEAIIATNTRERVALTVRATNNLVRHFYFGNYHHRVDTGNALNDAAANLYGNAMDIKSTAVAMYEDPLSKSTIWKMWYTVTDNGITDAFISAYNWYTGVNTYKVAGNMLTSGVQKAIKAVPHGSHVQVQPQRAIELPQRAIKLPSHERSLPDLNMDSISQAYNDDLMSTHNSLSGMTNIINNKGFDSNNLGNFNAMLELEIAQQAVDEAINTNTWLKFSDMIYSLTGGT